METSQARQAALRSEPPKVESPAHTPAGRGAAAGMLHGAAGVLTCAIPALLVTGPALPDIALSLVAVLFLAHSTLTGDRSWLRTPWVVAAVLVWIYLLLNTAFVAVHPDRAMERALPWIRFVVFAAALQHWVLSDTRWRRWLFAVTAAAVAFVAADTFLQYVAGRDVFGFGKFSADRLTGPLGEDEPKVGIYLERLMFPVLAAAIAWGGSEPRWRIAVPAVAVAGGVGAVLVSGERMPLLLSGLGLVLVWLLAPRLRRITLIAGLAALVTVAAFSFFDSAIFQRSIASTVRDTVATATTLRPSEDMEEPGDAGPGTHYSRVWRSGLNIVAAHPLFGIGLKNFRSVCPDPAYGATANIEARCALHPHNPYLEWLIEAGAVGLGGFLVLVVLWGRRAVTTFRSWAESPVAVGLVVAVALQLWPLQTTMSFFTSWNAAFFWLTLGWGLALIGAPRDAYRRDRTDASSSS